MDFHLTQAQEDLKSTARDFLADRSDGVTWAELVQLGWCNTDLGLVELALPAQESGRALLAQPWPATASGLPVYLTAGIELPGPVTVVDRFGDVSCHARRERLAAPCATASPPARH